MVFGWFNTGPRPAATSACSKLGADQLSAQPLAQAGRIGGPHASRSPLIRSAFPTVRSADLPYYEGREAGYRKAAVTGYVFRGDGRSPSGVKADGGFWPGITRHDYYYPDPLSYGSHVGSGQGSGYASFSRSSLIGVRFAELRGGGWVYAALVEGGLDFTVVGANFQNEQEVLAPGGVGWENVVAYRATRGPDANVVFVRNGFATVDPEAEKAIRLALSWDL